MPSLRGFGASSCCSAWPAEFSIRWPSRGRSTCRRGERRVGDGHLERVGLDVALADGQVDVVADRPGPVDEAADALGDLRRRGLRAGLAALELRVLGGRASAASGTKPGQLVGQVDAGGRPSPSLRAQFCSGMPLLVHVAAELVEEHVARHGQRLAQRQHAVRDAAGVLERDVADLDLARVVERGVRRDRARLERRRRGDQLERGAGRVAARDRAVGQRRAGLVGGQPLVVALPDDLREQVRVVRRVGAERRAPRRCGCSSRRTRPCRCRPRAPPGRRAGRRGRATGAAGGPAASASRQACAGSCRASPPAPSWRRSSPRRNWSYSSSTPALPTRSPICDPRVAGLLQLPGADLAHVAEQVRAELLVGVLAQEDRVDLDAGEVLLALLDVHHDVARDVLLDGRGRERQLLELLVHAPLRSRAGASPAACRAGGRARGAWRGSRAACPA